MDETKPKKMVNRNVTIALGIVCIILIVGLAGTIAYYTMQINNKDSQNTDLQNQVNDLDETLNLGKHMVWVNSQTVSQEAGSFSYWNNPLPYYSWNLNYAGYISIQILSSTTNNTYVRVIYGANGVNYDNQINVGSMGTAVFPVLPSNLQIRVGNTNLVGGATETVTITYYY